ncbi:MAG: phosphoenolpyruvate synthase [Candidatus Aenigmarchaeota archaeon]|nr:phosphoenolpyruvate synthase [Candidatus Aenigmarchaeota archaeon]
MKLIIPFSQISYKDVPIVGGKNASLGEMYCKLSKKGVRIPNGFAITAEAYDLFIKENNLDRMIKELLKDLDTTNMNNLRSKGKAVRSIIEKSKLPEKLENEILVAFKGLLAGSKGSVAVRSSATAEDLPDASFAGQQESYLNVQTEKELLECVVRGYASLFTDRAISYRADKGFDQFSVKLSIAVQKMVRSDLACSGVMFTIDPNTGFNNVVSIDGIWGLGEYIVQGTVKPDSFYVFKPTGKVIMKKPSEKKIKLIYGKTGTKEAKVPASEVRAFVLSDKEVEELGKYAMAIEAHYKTPMDIEWAKDGVDGKLYIVQARPETVHSNKSKHKVIEEYKLKGSGKTILQGISVGKKISSGKVHIIKNISEIGKFKPGEVLVSSITNPDWEPIMKIAAGIITERGGSTSHAAIVSRELGVPCIVGAEGAMRVLKDGQVVTIDTTGSSGAVYNGKIDFEVNKISLDDLPKTKTKVMFILATPEKAFDLASFQPDGVGLAREENIIASHIEMHPLYAIKNGKSQEYIDKLAEGIALLAVSVHPGQIIVRFSDFKTNEYANLKGGKEYEPMESNPMMGWRGASRYIDPKFKPAFMLELEAIKKVRRQMGLKNVDVMIPFCRTIDEGKNVLKIIEEAGLRKELKVYVMAEIPSNIILADQFAKIFDGFSIGSNDLTQLTLGMDRDNEGLAFDERNDAVKISIENLIKVAHKYKRPVGICGQAPSKYPEYVKFLLDNKIDTISVNPDVFLQTKLNVAKLEKKKK